MKLNNINTQNIRTSVVVSADVVIDYNDARFLFHAIRAIKEKIGIMNTDGLNIPDYENAREQLEKLIGNIDKVLSPTIEQILIPIESPNFIYDYPNVPQEVEPSAPPKEDIWAQKQRLP